MAASPRPLISKSCLRLEVRLGPAFTQKHFPFHLHSASSRFSALPSGFAKTFLPEHHCYRRRASSATSSVDTSAFGKFRDTGTVTGEVQECHPAPLAAPLSRSPQGGYVPNLRQAAGRLPQNGTGPMSCSCGSSAGVEPPRRGAATKLGGLCSGRNDRGPCRTRPMTLRDKSPATLESPRPGAGMRRSSRWLLPTQSAPRIKSGFGRWISDCRGCRNGTFVGISAC